MIAPASLDELLATIERLFASLDADEGIVRALILAHEGREVRARTNRLRLEHMLAFLHPLMPDLPEPERHALASSIITVCSVLSWMFMRDHCGYDGQQAGAAAADAVRLLIEGGVRRAAALRGG